MVEGDFGDFFSVLIFSGKEMGPGCPFIAVFHLAKCGGGVDMNLSTHRAFFSKAVDYISGMIITSFVTQNQMLEILKWNSKTNHGKVKKGGWGILFQQLEIAFRMPLKQPSQRFGSQVDKLISIRSSKIRWILKVTKIDPQNPWEGLEKIW